MKTVKEIRDALGIEREAVGVKYTDESPVANLADGQYAVCNGILEAANGKVIMLSKENSGAYVFGKRIGSHWRRSNWGPPRCW
jgi:hypothetical protein